MSCTKCGNPEGQCNYDCTRPQFENKCCDVKPVIKRHICDMAVSTIKCDASHPGIFPAQDDLNGKNSCPCVECPDGLMWTEQQAAYLKTLFEGMREYLVPYPQCGCEVMSQVGHPFPIAPSHDQVIERLAPEVDEMGNPVLDGEGNPVLVGTGLFDLKPDAGCCNGHSLKNSIMVGNGGWRNRYANQGGRPPNRTAEAVGKGGREGIDALLKYLCCVEDTVLDAEVVVMEQLPVVK